MLNVALLGGPVFSVNCSVCRPELGPAGRLLACYLFEFVGRIHRREKLADLFWGDLGEAKARAALNTAIWRIRKLLNFAESGGGGSLVTIGDDVILEPADFISVDTWRLQDASKRMGTVRDPVVLHEDETFARAAVAGYAGPFLEGHDGDWILQERERLHALFVATCQALMREEARRQQYEAALEHGRAILRTDPFRERVQRDVMLLLVLNGQRADAIRAYDNLVDLLRVELGIDPMPDTKLLGRQIRSGEVFCSLERLQCLHFEAGGAVKPR